MHRIVFAITSLEQHLETLRCTPEVYRPSACPHCGLDRCRRHGCYKRKADREGRLNPIAIPRFLCGGCGGSCSRLPQCIAPRRWYAWATQQQVLEKLLQGASLSRCSECMGLYRHTVRRWRDWLILRTQTFEFFLKSRFPDLGRSPDWKAFWSSCFTRMSLSEAMAWLDGDGELVP